MNATLADLCLYFRHFHSEFWSLSFSTENYRLQSAYEKNLIIKMVLVSRIFYVVWNENLS